jgi:hypothetical protein
VYILTKKTRLIFSTMIDEYWTGKVWSRDEEDAKVYRSEAIATNAMRRIMSSGREDEQNITVKKLTRTQGE